MKLTDEIIAEIECCFDMRKANGDVVWEDGDEIEVKIAGTFASDKFITILNRTKNPVISSNGPAENK